MHVILFVAEYVVQFEVKVAVLNVFFNKSRFSYKNSIFAKLYIFFDKSCQKMKRLMASLQYQQEFAILVYNHQFQSFLTVMDYTSVLSLEQFQEEKFININQSLQFSPNAKPTFFSQQNLPHQLSKNQPSNPEPLTPISKANKSRRRAIEEDKNVNKGHWLLQQNKKYHWFLQIHYKHFVNRHMRRMDKIFKSMQNFIGTRQAEQCRSHHQKMQKKYHNFSTIITNLRIQHYGTTEVDPLAEDMSNGGCLLIQELPTIGMLIQEQSSNVSVEVKERKRSANRSEKVESEMLENVLIGEEQQKEGSCLPEVYNSLNMLEESNMNIGELMLYHQKEDNSGLFNFQ